MSGRTFNVKFGSSDANSVQCSNPAAAPFVIDHERCASAEGFIQALMRPENDPRHKLALKLAGMPAYHIGSDAARDYAYWKGRRMEFRGTEHEALIERGIRAKFAQNPLIMRALRSTGDAELTHELGHPERPRTCLPKHVFLDILTCIRDDQLPRWPYGTHEEPLVVTVWELEEGGGFWEAAINGDKYWCRTALGKQAALASLLFPLTEAHPDTVIRIQSA